MAAIEKRKTNDGLVRYFWGRAMGRRFILKVYGCRLSSRSLKMR